MAKRRISVVVPKLKWLRHEELEFYTSNVSSSVKHVGEKGGMVLIKQNRHNTLIVKFQIRSKICQLFGRVFGPIAKSLNATPAEI